jgi:hypothetical protein
VRRVQVAAAVDGAVTGVGRRVLAVNAGGAAEADARRARRSPSSSISPNLG